MASGFLSPGVSYILKPIPKLLFLQSSSIPMSIPLWGRILAAVLAPPVWAAIRALYVYVREEREIRALGAVNGCGIWICFLGRIKQGRVGYPFDVVEPMIRRYGKTFNTRILGEDRRIFATDFEGWEKGCDNFLR
ncbi:hypothetical protein R3P38DRAFT_2845317, partial [Favolaschia claudopus]